MNSRIRTLHPIFFAIVIYGLTLFLPGSVFSQDANPRKPYFESLTRKLIADGFDRQQIDQVFSHQNVVFADDIVSRFFMHRESKLNYGQFLKAETIAKARTYMKENARDLAGAEQSYGVDKTVIVAILLVETRLGTFVGNSSIFNTLATMASLENNANRELVWRQNLQAEEITKEKYTQKALTKSKWAYSELKALLTYSRRENIHPVEINGSYAGAMGISQFMPSNALTIAVDGNKDGMVDLFTHADAIASVANYLKRYGWKPGITREQKYKAVMHYNHSSYYANTILDVADLLKG